MLRLQSYPHLKSDASQRPLHASRFRIQLITAILIGRKIQLANCSRDFTRLQVCLKRSRDAKFLLLHRVSPVHTGYLLIVTRTSLATFRSEAYLDPPRIPPAEKGMHTIVDLCHG